MRNITLRKFAPALLASLALLPATRADELSELREALAALQQKIAVLERKQELRDEAAAAAAPTTAKVTVNDKGYTLASADAANSIRLRGLIQLDHRWFFEDDGSLQNNSFVLRRARIIVEGALGKQFTYQIVPEFGGANPAIVDANFTWTLSPELGFKFGRFKAPVGLELLQSDSWTFFNERTVVSALVPNRDLGIVAQGDLFGGKLNYTAGIIGGVADGANTTNSDFDNEKEVVGRVFATPFKDNAGSPVQGLGFGIAGTYGRAKGTAGRTAGFRTDGQQTIFSYLASTITDGPNWRITPQLDYRNGSFGLLGEYVISTVNVRPNPTGVLTELQNKAWQVSAGYVLTGENSSYNGVVPAADFSLSKGTWGAFEVAARYANLKLDNSAYPLFANPITNINESNGIGLGLNWYLSKAVRFTFDYYHTEFKRFATPTPTTNPILKNDENTFISRFQIAF
jgi:phosphate-selective porin OprO/OprP